VTSFLAFIHQLLPLLGVRKYEMIDSDPIFYHNHLLWDGALNAFVELDGTQRFRNDPEWVKF